MVINFEIIGIIILHRLFIVIIIVVAQKTSHKNDLKLDINLIGSIIFLNNFFFDKNFN